MTSGGAEAPSQTELDRAQLSESAGRFENELRTRGLVYSDADLQRYLESLTQLLSAQPPAPASGYRIAVLRDPGANAFALPNGAIYVSAGALSNVEDEAQLALVIAHEMTHISSEHALYSRYDRRTTTIAAKVTGIALGPFAGLSDMGFAAALAEYSRDQESEADREGMRRIAGAGFETATAPGLFVVLNSVEDAVAIAGPWNDHPGNLERQRACSTLVERGDVPANPGGRNDVEGLQRVTEKVAIESVRLRVATGQHALARVESERAMERYGETAALRTYQGESIRQLRNAPADAEKSFRRALELDPSHGAARRGLAQVLVTRGDTATAEAVLNEYLVAYPDGADARLIERMLSRIRATGAKNAGKEP